MRAYIGFVGRSDCRADQARVEQFVKLAERVEVSFQFERSRIARSFGVTAVPESFLVDREGIIRNYYINRRNWSATATLMCLRSMVKES